MRVTEIAEVSRSRMRISTDEEFTFVLYRGELHRLHIRQGEEIEEDALRAIREEILPKRAKLRAMNLLKNRDYTVRQLRDKLKEGGYPQAGQGNRQGHAGEGLGRFRGGGRKPGRAGHDTGPSGEKGIQSGGGPAEGAPEDVRVPDAEGICPRAGEEGPTVRGAIRLKRRIRGCQGLRIRLFCADSGKSSIAAGLCKCYKNAS